MSHSRDEYYDYEDAYGDDNRFDLFDDDPDNDNEYDAPPDDRDDAPPDDHDDAPPDDDAPSDDDHDKQILLDEDHLFRCTARYKNHIPCMQIFSSIFDINNHLQVEHKTHKWLVEVYRRCC